MAGITGMTSERVWVHSWRIGSWIPIDHEASNVSFGLGAACWMPVAGEQKGVCVHLSFLLVTHEASSHTTHVFMQSCLQVENEIKNVSLDLFKEWQPCELNLHFFSKSSDGFFSKWTIKKCVWGDALAGSGIGQNSYQRRKIALGHNKSAIK